MHMIVYLINMWDPHPILIRFQTAWMNDPPSWNYHSLENGNLMVDSGYTGYTGYTEALLWAGRGSFRQSWQTRARRRVHAFPFGLLLMTHDIILLKVRTYSTIFQGGWTFMNHHKSKLFGCSHMFTQRTQGFEFWIPNENHGFQAAPSALHSSPSVNCTSGARDAENLTPQDVHIFQQLRSYYPIESDIISGPKKRRSVLSHFPIYLRKKSWERNWWN